MASSPEEPVVTELPELDLIPGTDIPEEWRHASRPRDLAEMIGSTYSIEDRQRLAAEATAIAFGEVKDAYRNPTVRTTAENVAKLILGLAEFPEMDPEDTV